MALVFDCETYRIDNAVEFLEPVLPEPVKADGRLTDPAKIAADIAKKEAAEAERVKLENQKLLDRCALDPMTGRIVALGWAWEGEQVATVRIAPTEQAEAEMLRDFASILTDPSTRTIVPLVGYNSHGFDMPFLRIRAKLLGVNFPTLNTDRYRSPHHDVMLELCDRDMRKAKSLRFMAQRLGLDMSDAFSGAEVAQLVESGNWDGIKSHCEWDVLTCKAVAEWWGILQPARRAVA